MKTIKARITKAGKNLFYGFLLILVLEYLASYSWTKVTWIRLKETVLEISDSFLLLMLLVGIYYLVVYLHGKKKSSQNG